METLNVAVKRLAHGNDLPLPEPATAESAGIDLFAAITEDVTLPPGVRAAIPTGVAIALPSGFEAQIRPRSGLAVRHGLTVLNSPGTIDADYRGEINVILVNVGDEFFTVERGMRIAQLVVAPIYRVIWKETSKLPPTKRGTDGHGSTGLYTTESAK